MTLNFWPPKCYDYRHEFMWYWGLKGSHPTHEACAIQTELHPWMHWSHTFVQKHLDWAMDLSESASFCGHPSLVRDCAPLTSCCGKSPCVLGSWSKSVISTLYVTNRKVGKVTDNVPYLFPSVYTLILDPVFFLLHTPRLVHFEQTLFYSALLSSQKS